MQSLITNSEIKQFMGLDHDLEICSDAQRFRYEHKEFKDCLGSTFYSTLKTALATYDDYSTYLDATTYAINDVVEYNGTLYIAKVETVGVPPSNITNWKSAPKFDAAATCDYEEFYCHYLGPYLAHCIVRARLPYLRSILTNEGLVQVDKEGLQKASKDAYATLADRISTDIDLLYGMLVTYIKDNNSTGCFDTSLIITNDCGDDCENKGSASDPWGSVA